MTLNLAPYKSSIDKALSWMDDWLSQDDYDHKADEVGLMTPWEAGPVEVYAFSDDTPLMPSIFDNPGGFGADRIYLVHLLVEAGLVEAKVQGGKRFYRRTKEKA